MAKWDVPLPDMMEDFGACKKCKHGAEEVKTCGDCYQFNLCPCCCGENCGWCCEHESWVRSEDAACDKARNRVCFCMSAQFPCGFERI